MPGKILATIQVIYDKCLDSWQGHSSVSDGFRRKTTVVNTYVSLSSHERHVSFMVPCKEEADGEASEELL